MDKVSIVMLMMIRLLCATAIDHNGGFSRQNGLGYGAQYEFARGYNNQRELSGRGGYDIQRFGMQEQQRFGKQDQMQGAALRAGERSPGGYSGKYTATFYNDNDVYGYEAVYPGGEALYINYRSDDARARRGPEFSRNRPYSNEGSYKDQSSIQK